MVKGSQEWKLPAGVVLRWRARRRLILLLIPRLNPANPASTCLEFGAGVYLCHRQCQLAQRNSWCCLPSESGLAGRSALKVQVQGPAAGLTLDRQYQYQYQCLGLEGLSILVLACPLVRLESIRLAECSTTRLLTCDFGLWLSLSSFEFSGCLTKSSWNPRSNKFTSSASMPAGNAEHLR